MFIYQQFVRYFERLSLRREYLLSYHPLVDHLMQIVQLHSEHSALRLIYS
jgi:hypothetical protein